VAVAYGKYLLERKLAEGGMAEIFLARPAPGAPGATAPASSASSLGAGDRRSPAIVVKRLFSHHSAEKEFVRMFFNEARLAARLKHPNIVDIFDQGEVDGTYYLAMEYIAGEDLRSIATQADVVGKRPPLAVVCRIIVDMLAGLHYAHTLTDDQGQPLGLVHRDISPQNVLVTYDGAVKVIDFGIAKATQAHNNEQTQAGLIKGKYAYMSPEQTRSGALDARADVFSAGILLWELIAWRRLFKRASDLATLVAVTEEPAPSMTLYTPEVPKELDEVVLKSLAMDPADRWASAKEFHDALLACMEQLGWDGSREALGRYMRELFQQKIQQERKQEARAALDAERAASAMSMRNINASAAAKPGAGATPPVRATMPLQVINPAMAAAARKAMQQQSGRTGSAPPRPPDASRPSGRSLQRPPTPNEPPPAPALLPATTPPLSPSPSGASLIPPLPPPPSGLSSGQSSPASSRSALSLSGQQNGSALSQKSSSITPPPSSTSITGPFGTRSDPLGISGERERPRSTQTLAPQSSSQIRVVMAVVLGIVVGVLAVLMLQLMGGRPPR
jgi:serine/threonine-protein kinase